MIDPHELENLYGDFLAEAEFEFDSEAECLYWCNINNHFLRWLAEENRIRVALAKEDREGRGSFAHMRRLFSADA